MAYRVVKRLRRLGQFPEDVDVLIVSAKYGVIPHDRPIPDYDLRMTPERALEQANQNREFLNWFLQGRSYWDVFVSVGKDYLLALEPFNAWQGRMKVAKNKGTIGVQLKVLKDWLLRAGQRNPRSS